MSPVRRFAPPVLHPQGIHRHMPLYAWLYQKNRISIEPFGGLASGTLHTLPVPDEIVIEIDRLFYSFWRGLQRRSAVEIVELAKQALGQELPRDDYAALLYRLIRTPFGNLNYLGKGKRVPKDKDRFIERLLRVKYRVEDVSFVRGDAFKLLLDYPREASIFADPPYPIDKRPTSEHMDWTWEKLEEAARLVAEFDKALLIVGANSEKDIERAREIGQKVGLTRQFLYTYTTNRMNPTQAISRKQHHVILMNYDPLPIDKAPHLPRVYRDEAKRMAKELKKL